MLQGESIEIDESIDALQVKAPSIVAFGETRDLATDVKVIIEGNALIMPSIVTALHFCFASYYVFNIFFPPEFHPIMLFLDKFLYNLKPSVPKLSFSVVVLSDNLKQIQDSL